MRIYGVVDGDLVLAFFRGRHDGRLKKQPGRKRAIKSQSVGEIAGALFGVCADDGLGFGGVVSQAVAQLNAGTANFDLQFAELSIPGFVFWIIAQHVVRRAIVHAITNGAINVIAVVVGLAAGIFRQQIHGVMGGGKVVRFLH